VLEGHLGEVYSAKLFPTGIVVLSGGADMQVKVWSAKDGSCTGTMKGHTKVIMDTAIREKGKTLIYVSMDRTATLWSCGDAECVAVMASVEDHITCCSLAGLTMFHPLQDVAGDSLEQGELDSVDNVQTRVKADHHWVFVERDPYVVVQTAQEKFYQSLSVIIMLRYVTFNSFKIQFYDEFSVGVDKS
jgi:WD40 repeat protein